MTYWNFIHNDHTHEIQCDTKEEAVEWANQWWDDSFSLTDMQNGQTEEDEGFLVEITLNYEGEEIEISRIKHTLYYQHYHGDYAEHRLLGSELI